MRQVVLDTETTGLEVSKGHRIVEIGCVELINRKLTGQTFHHYIQPDCEIDDGALSVHGIDRDFLADKPRFSQIGNDLLAFLQGAEVIIHNAPFDVGFIDAELAELDGGHRLAQVCAVLDSLELARERHPGQKNTLDALCRRYGIDNAHRELHGALLDARILADVYLGMTGGQTSLSLAVDAEARGRAGEPARGLSGERPPLPVIEPSEAELAAHRARLREIDAASGGRCVWLQLHNY